mgnify:CR=1 FL=1
MAINNSELEIRLAAAAKAAGVGAVPEKQEFLPRLSARTLKVLGWTRDEERFGVLDVQAMLGMLRTKADQDRLRQALEVGNIKNLIAVASALDSRAKVMGLSGIMFDYLGNFQPLIVSGLSPFSEGGIY